MTIEDLELGLAPVVEVLEEHSTLLTHISQVQYGILIGLGIVSGLILIYILLHRF